MKALISVTDKKFLANFAGDLEKMGWDIIATPGTHNYLLDKGINSREISDCTGTDCLLNGKVKTLHPAIFAGLLATKSETDELEFNDFNRINLICCNPYKLTSNGENFSCRDEDCLNNIDIGGISLLRAGAKNYANVVVVSDNRDYKKVTDALKNKSLDLEFRRKLAGKAFEFTAGYDRLLTNYFKPEEEKLSLKYSLNFKKNTNLRYGENPHQKSALYGQPPFTKIDNNTELSFNNYQDITAGVELAKNFNRPVSVIIKHTVPCGVARGENIKVAYLKSLRADPMSAFGGIAVLNREVSPDLASVIKQNFYEVVVAPRFHRESVELLSQKKRLSIITYQDFKNGDDFRKVPGGLLVQDSDKFKLTTWKTVSKKEPEPDEINDLKFAWKIAARLKSNAAVIAGDNMSLGLGSGETARVDAVKIAALKMDRVEGIQKLENNFVMASDGFFPFPDSIEQAAGSGVKAVVEPGGSKNDDKIIKAADRLGISLVFTGRRHFLH